MKSRECGVTPLNWRTNTLRISKTKVLRPEPSRIIKKRDILPIPSPSMQNSRIMVRSKFRLILQRSNADEIRKIPDNGITLGSNMVHYIDSTLTPPSQITTRLRFTVFLIIPTTAGDNPSLCRPHPVPTAAALPSHHLPTTPEPACCGRGPPL